jgi:hypothetical protein
VAESVGVLCTRGRVEEKLLMAALVEAGFVAITVTPAPGPAPLGPTPGWPLAVDTASGEVAGIVIDRLQDRALASALLELEPVSIRLVGAGVAAGGSRLAIAAAIARGGLPRPTVFATHDEASGLEAAKLAGYPATFLPLEPKTPGLTLWDADTAEAVLEHRAMLGQRIDTLGLVLAGTGHDSIRIIVAGGKAIGYEGNDSLANGATFELAVATAEVLEAELVGIEIIDSAAGPMIWDVDPVPDFRSATPIGTGSVAAQIAAHIHALVAANGAAGLAIGGRV